MSASEAVSTRGPHRLRVITTVCAALILAASGALYLRIGVKGMLEALTFSGRAIGAVIFLCGIATTGAALGLAILLCLALGGRTASRRSHRMTDTWGAVVIIGCASSGALGFVLFVVQLTAFNFSPWLAVWAAAILSSGSILYYAIRAGLRVPSIKAVAGGLSLGLLVSLVSVVYTDFYLPSSVAPLLSVSVSINKAAIDKANGTATIPISITLRNRLTVGVYVLAAYYDVAGRVSAGISPTSQAAEASAAADGQPYGAFTGGYSYQLIQESPIDSGGNYFLNPNETDTVNDAVTIPTPTSYDAIEVSYRILIMRDDRFELDTSYSATPSGDSGASLPGWVRGQFPYDTSYLYWYGKISYDSYLLDLIRPPEAVHAWYMLPPIDWSSPIIPEIVGTVSGAGRPETTGPTSSEILSRQNLYGMVREGGGSLTIALPSSLGIPATG